MTEHLIERHGFVRYRETRPRPYKVEVEHISCIRRIADLHYLCYSEVYGYFSIRVLYDKPKGGQGKRSPEGGDGKVYWNSIMIPRVCRTIESVDAIVKAICDDL